MIVTRLWRTASLAVAGTAVLAPLLFMTLAPVTLAGVMAPATDPPSTPPKKGAKAEELVEQLASPLFVERQKATRELVEFGIAARGALEQACNSSDAEVRDRARAILQEVRTADFRDRLNAFASDFDGGLKLTLPGWEQYVALVGDRPVARQLFIDMQRAEPELLEALSEGSETASKKLAERCREVVQQIVQSQRESQPVLGTVAAFLFVGSAEGVTFGEQADSQIYTWMIQNRQFFEAAQKGASSPILKKLIGQWVLKDVNSSVTVQNLQSAGLYDLKSEALALSTRLLGDGQIPASTRQYAVLMVGRYGDKSHQALLEKLLEDQSSCNPAPAPAANRPELQLRDVALAMLVHLTGQNVRDYGFLQAQTNPITLYLVNTLVFVGPAQRDAALKKWSRWRAEHPAS